MNQNQIIPRKFPRYDTDVKISFHSLKKIRTEVDFKREQDVVKGDAHRHIGFTKNISAQGLCFESNMNLEVGEILWLELHVPKVGGLIYMQGEVRWTQLNAANPSNIKSYLTGVHVSTVDGTAVQTTVYYDEEYDVQWSEFLDRVLGTISKKSHKKA